MGGGNIFNFLNIFRPINRKITKYGRSDEYTKNSFKNKSDEFRPTNRKITKYGRSDEYAKNSFKNKSDEIFFNF